VSNPYRYDDDLVPPRPAYPPANLGADPAMRMLMPVGRSIWAIIAGYLGLFSVLCLPAPLALLISLVAIWDIRRDPNKHGLGRAIFGLVMGAVFTSVMLFWLVLLALQNVRG
jgi:hypothetical protein